MISDEPLKTIAIHQPNYLPWLGFFYKMYACDHFILLDDVAYSKGSFTARTFYRKQFDERQKSYLSIPLKKYSISTPIHELLIDHTQNWPVKHLNQIANIYRGAPFFDHYYPWLRAKLELAKEYTTLADWNCNLIKAINRLLDIGDKITLSSKVSVRGESTFYLTQLVRYYDGNKYLSGQGAKKYQDEARFKEAKIELEYLNVYHYLESRNYFQQQGPWLNGLSVIDALMNIGTAGIIALFKEYGQFVR